MDAPLINGYYLDGNHDGGVYNSFNLAAYAYCRQSPVVLIDPDGNQYNHSILLAPRRIKVEYPNNEGSFVMQDGYKFTKSTTHLLHLVSGVNKQDIAKAKVDFSTLGDAEASITLGSKPSKATITHYYSNKTKYYGTAGDLFISFFERNAHEVGHIPQLEAGYVGHIAGSVVEYAKNLISGQDWHDGSYSTKEPQADIGSDTFTEFNNFINNNYNKGGLEKLFKNPNNTQEDIIGRIDQWWKAYEKSKNSKN